MNVINLANERRTGIVKPLGRYDDHGRWYPSPFERCECCDRIKQPSKNRPLSILKHCRTRKHIEYLMRKHKAK